ncbi:MAG: aspartate kinase [Firmicutes bacterium]|nr:aspartate kinase [Bacillota bacterium]
MGIVVQKFGGSSTGPKDRRLHVQKHIIDAKNLGYDCVVVVSAMGRAGDPYATDTLRSLVVCDSKYNSARELDLLMSCGETIAASVIAQELTNAGYQARAFTGGQAGVITDHNFGSARIIEVKPEKIKNALASGFIPVIAGFQGLTPDGEVTTLGRGAGDISAVAVGVALGAKMVEIYTDVDGIMTADPRIEPHAQRLHTATYKEIVEMAHLGAKVIHPRAMEIAMEGRISIRIRATGSDSPGTLVQASPGSPKEISDRTVTGIAHVCGMAQVQLEVSEDCLQSNLPLVVFEKLADSGISLDMIYVSPEKIAFIIEERWITETEILLKEFPIGVCIQQKVAKVSAVGAGMRGVPGVMAQVVKALQGAGVPILQTTDSHANISCLVREEHIKPAVRALHAQFELDRLDNSRE